MWLAHRSDGRYEGKVAVKLLNAALIGKASERRFRREGEVLARLAHPHITPALRDPSRAIDLVNQSVERLTSGTTGNPLAASVALVRRAKLELELGRPANAEADAARALALEEQSLTPGRRSVLRGRTYLTLGQARQANGKGDQAKRAFAEAVEQLRPALGPDHPDTRRAEARAASGVSPAN